MHLDFLPLPTHCTHFYKKGKLWKRDPEDEETVKTLTWELKTYQSLGPVHPRDPVTAEWGFAEHDT